MNGMESTLGHNDQPGSEGSGPAVSAGRKASAGSLLVRVGNAFVSWLKEGTTTVIALAVVAVALSMLLRAFLDQSLSDAQTEAMMHGLSLLGVVMGYYFGRSPVERRAESAEKAVDKERSQAEKHVMVASAAMESQRISEGKLLDAKMTLEHAKAALTTRSTGSLSDAPSEVRSSGADAPADSTTRAYQLLDQLQRRL